MSIRFALGLSCTLTLSACASTPRHAPATSTHAAEATTRREQLTRAYASFAQAVQARDLEAVMAHLTSDIEWRMADGSVLRRAEVTALMKDYLATRTEG